MTILRNRVSRAAILIGIAAIMMSVAAGHRAEAAFCPQYVAEYCVVEKDGFRHTDWTNPCFAAERGARVLHAGACLGPVCTNDWVPVCSINQATGKRHTYANLCWSDLANATLVHKGACHHHHHPK